MNHTCFAFRAEADPHLLSNQSRRDRRLSWPGTNVVYSSTHRGKLGVLPGLESVTAEHMLPLYILSTDTNLDQNLIFIAGNHVYKHCGDVCNDMILMPQFLEVVRQHILGVWVMFYCCVVGNLTDFPLVK